MCHCVRIQSRHLDLEERRRVKNHGILPATDRYSVESNESDKSIGRVTGDIYYELYLDKHEDVMQVPPLTCRYNRWKVLK